MESYDLLISAADTLRDRYNEIVEHVNNGTFSNCDQGAKDVLSALRWAVGHLEVARELTAKSKADQHSL